MKVDMSPQAVKGRLKLVGQLWRLAVSLRDAKKESDKRIKERDSERSSELRTGFAIKEK
jgi:hypothetical protein